MIATLGKAHRRAAMLAVVATAFAAPALAQNSNVSPSHKFSWSENTGWMNWRDAGSPPGSQGAVIGGSYMSGFVWGDNIGWVKLGDGSPADGVHYANSTGVDSGVNIDTATGDLFGLAWGENVGWITFDTRTALGPSGQQARFDSAARRLRGYAWGDNIGWINLDDDEHYVGIACAADFNGNGVADVPDIFLFLALWFGGDSAADFNGNGTNDVPDIFNFLALWFAGCGA